MISGIFFLSLPNERKKNNFVTYTSMQLVALATTTIQTIFCRYYLARILKKSDEMDAHLMVPRHFDNISHVVEILKVLTKFMVVYCCKVLLIVHSDNTLFHRIYAITAYTGQKITLLFIITLMVKIQVITSKNFSSFSSISSEVP